MADTAVAKGVPPLTILIIFKDLVVVEAGGRMKPMQLQPNTQSGTIRNSVQFLRLSLMAT